MNRWQGSRIAQKPNSGMGVVHILLILLILGGIVAAVLASPIISDGNKSTSDKLASSRPVDSSPANAANNISEGAQVTCRTDFASVQTAVSYYETLNGRAPTSLTDLCAMMKDPVSSAYFSISIDVHHPGQIDVATRGHSAAAGDANCAYAG